MKYKRKCERLTKKMIRKRKCERWRKKMKGKRQRDRDSRSLAPLLSRSPALLLSRSHDLPLSYPDTPKQSCTPTLPPALTLSRSTIPTVPSNHALPLSLPLSHPLALVIFAPSSDPV